MTATQTTTPEILNNPPPGAGCEQPSDRRDSGEARFDDRLPNIPFDCGHRADYEPVYFGGSTEDQIVEADAWDREDGPDSIPDQDRD